MTGSWMTAVASRVFRDETFRLRIAPAIADLQFQGASCRFRNYAGIARAFVLGIATDSRIDLGLAFTPERVRTAWRRGVLCYLGIVVLSALSQLIGQPVASLGGNGILAILASSFAAYAITSVCWGMAVAAFLIARRTPGAGRLVIASSVLAAVVTTGAAVAVRPARNMMDAYRFSASWRAFQGHFLDARLADVVATSNRQPLSPEMLRSHRSDDLRSGAAVFVCAIFGLAIARISLTLPLKHTRRAARIAR